jgi:hypothetical protein
VQIAEKFFCPLDGCSQSVSGLKGGFKRRSDLRRHLRKVHGRELCVGSELMTVSTWFKGITVVGRLFFEDGVMAPRATGGVRALFGRIGIYRILRSFHCRNSSFVINYNLDRPESMEVLYLVFMIHRFCDDKQL